MSRWKLVGGIMLAGVLAFVLLNLILALRPARKPLLPSPVRSVPEADNGWALLKEAGRLRVDTHVDWTKHPYYGPAAVHDAAVQDQLAQNGPALAKLDAALARHDLAIGQAEFQQLLDPANLGDAAAIRELARLKGQRSANRAAAGDAEGAMTDALDTCLLGRRLAHSGNLLIGYLTAVAIEAVGDGQVRNLSGFEPPLFHQIHPDPTAGYPLPPLTQEQRQQFQRAILAMSNEDDVLPAFRECLAGELARERWMLRDGPTSVLHQSPALRAFPWIYDPNDTQRISEEAVRTILTEAAKPAWQRKPLEQAPPARRLPPIYNPVGRTLATITTPVYGKAVDRSDTVRFYRRGTALILALRLFDADHGRLPATLDELVAAKLLPAVPIDPFDGQPIRYQPRKGLIYSVSSNHRDDGGERAVNTTGKDDQVLWLPFVNRASDPRGPRGESGN